MAELWEGGKVGVIRYDEGPPNFSRLWNVGLDVVEEAIRSAGEDEWDVAVLNSDVVVPAQWFSRLSEAMRSTTAVLAYPDQFRGSRQILHTQAGPIDVRQRITGYAHLMRGEAGLRYDETMAWWYSDDDMDWNARERGGPICVPGLGVEHRDPNGQTKDRVELQQQDAREREPIRNTGGRTPNKATVTRNRT